VLGDTGAAGALLDRFLHHAEIRLHGRSWRLHERQQRRRSTASLNADHSDGAMSTPTSTIPIQPSPSGRATAVPLVKAMLREILPHAPKYRGPIPLRSGTFATPCFTRTGVGFVHDESLFPPEDVTP